MDLSHKKILMFSKDLDRREIMPLQHKALGPKIIFEPCSTAQINKIKEECKINSLDLFQLMAPRMLVEVLEAS